MIRTLSSGVFALLAVAIVACGSSSGSETDGGPPLGGPFDLNLKLKGTLLTGDPWPTSWYVVVRDRADGALVFFEKQPVDQPSTMFERTLAKKLQAGHSYQIGIAGDYYLPCDAGKDIWYDEIASVADDVTIDRTIVRNAAVDVRGCDIIHQPIALPAGTYQNASPILGSSGNGITVIVSPTGRLYRKRVIALCPSNTCSSSLTSDGPTCDQEITPIPMQTVVDLGNSGSATRLAGSATINTALGQFDYQGMVTTWTSPTLSTKCCEQSFTTALVRTGPPTEACR